MADNLQRRQPEDKRFISLSESWEVAYWTQALGVTESQLRAAVRAVGNGTAKVRAHLRK
ncbi:DUF3606 domain-containing protein [Klebsiella quasipneumoniae]|uniref:DUF3606 domain-containing protein n=1 Tax=Klebsiella quasipneumoniae TaxID=1463165 RepID=UPI000C7B79C8|nr:DUF3606 domain-containing protein [Klebsiella quasipneumoniae]MBC9925380.1 DUF3606 domain-containing protein [Klebsiella quasipneumoniae]MBC9942215.1 DUF3606 domain-containing protein [Klebsiella quasipneumoniae]MBC9952401.1 DUF3606 domain-containing protein [Klebsiella quasipneumoniae]PLM20333.1 DUF3606 domain-containing protein [Klebsiella quasipneumoniae]QQX97697.1 DUF3606 domain-containing protein [Klebsiella quasipneumoniae]